MTTAEAPPRRPRGRPRDPRADGKILAATREAFAELGVHGASMSAIADRAGVGKPTIYLRWPNRQALIAAAAEHVRTDDLIRDEVEAVKDDIRSLLEFSWGPFMVEVLFDELRRERTA